MTLPDVQNTKSNHNVYLEDVGITDLKLPISVLQKTGGLQNTIADFSCFVDLDASVKGISMSRLLEVLHDYTYRPLNSNVVIEITKKIRQKSESNKCKLEVRFPYFLRKSAPVSNKSGYIHYNLGLLCNNIKKKVSCQYYVGVYATSLCPCSKEISDNSAHNQRCYIEVTFETNDWVWFEDIITITENSASCEIFSILKRPDEKYVTENAYNNPLFVEDIARNVYVNLDEIKEINSFNIKVSSDESIHLHKAVAFAAKKN